MRISPLANALFKQILSRFPKVYGYAFVKHFPRERFLQNPQAALEAIKNAYLLQPFVEIIAPHSKKIVLFGSRGMGLNSPQSDFDVFVVTNNIKNVQDLAKKARLKLPASLDLTVYNQQQEARIHLEEPSFQSKLESGIIVWQNPGQDIIA
jgi:predicted nucleotidyltransferase